MGKLKRLVTGDDRDPREELAEIFGAAVPAGGDIQPEALAWAREVVDTKQLGEVEAIAKLRGAEPRLGLKSATYLARRLYV